MKLPGVQLQKKKPRTIILGDIHGCCEAFRRLLIRCELNVRTDRLVILGDALDRGPDSAGVFELLQVLEAEMGERFVYLLGNHDRLMLDSVRSPKDLLLWEMNGAEATIRSFSERGDEVRRHFGWFEGRPYYYETEDYVCVHASLMEDEPGKEAQQTLLWDRSLLNGTRRYTGKLGIGGHTPLKHAAYIRPRDGRLFYLKDEKKALLPRRGFMVLDTGCVFGRKLTALIITGRYFELRSV